MDFPGSTHPAADPGVHRHRRRDGAATLELAAAAVVRLAPDHPLAGTWDSRAVPDPVRRAWAPRLPWLRVPPAHGRALGVHDPGGAGAIPARHPRALRLRFIHERGQGAMMLTQ